QRDRTRDEGRQSARLRGACLQAAKPGGARSRFHVAHDTSPSGARTHRNFQPVILRGSPGGARSPGTARERKDARKAGHQRHVEGALQGYPRLRALPRAQWNSDLEVLFACFQRRAETALSGTDRQPGQDWKFAMGDIEERKLWDKYMAAYEDMIRNTSRPEAPWFVVPADNKWFTRLVV